MSLKILSVYRFISSLLYSLYIRIRYNVQLGEGVFFNKTPNIYLRRDCYLKIGDNVTINSNNRRYHINMHSRCKILLDRPGAEVFIGSNSRIHGTCIHAYKSIRIGKNCLIAANTQIIDGNGHDLALDNPENRINTIGSAKPINIGDNVWIGSNVFILPGITIGNGSIISANSVVASDIPDKCIAGGNPAIILKKA